MTGFQLTDTLPVLYKRTILMLKRRVEELWDDELFERAALGTSQTPSIEPSPINIDRIMQSIMDPPTRRTPGLSSHKPLEESVSTRT
jgi:hypothetical protein